jgi:hypothetical protein
MNESNIRELSHMAADEAKDVQQANGEPMSASEKADFKKELDGKGLKEAMELEKDLKKKHDEEEEALKRSLKGNDKEALSGYRQNHGTAKINKADFEKMKETIQKEGLRDEKALKSVKEGEDPEQARKNEQEWLNKTFKDQKTDTFVLHGQDGKAYVAIMGVSADELAAARDIEKQKAKADMTHDSVQQKIAAGLSLPSAVAAGDEGVKAPAVPNVPRADKSQAIQH